MERMYQEARMIQMKHRRREEEHALESAHAELEGLTLEPQITRMAEKLALHAPVHERALQWWLDRKDARQRQS